MTLVTTDASGVALGAYLSQIHHDGVERTVAFASRTLSPTERAYSTSEREALACMWACEHWHYYLYGRRFTLRTDHSALKALLSGGQKGRKPMRLLRWADRLQQYDYEIQYRPGSDNVVADLLSRSCETSEPDLHSNSSGSHHNLTKSVKTSNSNHCIIDLSHIDAITYMNSEEDLQLNSVFGSPALASISPKRLAEATAADPLLQSVITLTQTSEWKSKPSNSELLPYYRVREELSFINGTLFRGDRAVIPTSLCKDVLQLAHEGHPGIVKMKSRCRDCTWWPGMDSDIEHHVLHCEPCQLADKSVHAAVPPMTPIRRPDLPWSRVSVDIKGELPGAPSNSRYLLVAYDLHSKWPEVRPVSSISTTVIITWLRHLFSTWGLPDEIITDNGLQFTSHEFSKFLSDNGNKHIRTANYHPQSNTVERFNRVLSEGLRIARIEHRDLMSTRFDSWDVLVDTAQHNWRVTGGTHDRAALQDAARSTPENSIPSTSALRQRGRHQV